jgi:4-hydroxybenzoate polyprenyl transferase
MKKKIAQYAHLIRIKNPTGILLLLLPCIIGVFFIKRDNCDFSYYETLRIVFLFIVGSIIMRSAGCIINDIFDRKIDSRVKRTKFRPIANKSITVREALILLVILLFCGLIILLQFNSRAVLSGFVALFLVIIYPLMKRIVYFPQIFLGIAFNFGVIISALEINNEISLETLILFAALVMWTLIYDTIYGFQDIDDDLKIGVKSLAIKFSSYPRMAISILAITMFSLLFLCGLLKNLSSYYYLINFINLCYLLLIIIKCDYKNPSDCLKKFKANLFVGILILLSIA